MGTDFQNAAAFTPWPLMKKRLISPGKESLMFTKTLQDFCMIIDA